MAVWGDGAAYEAYVGRWSRLVAERFVRWLGPAPGLRWLDVGCGTGALTDAVTAAARPRQVTGVDSSRGFLDGRRGVVVADGGRLPVRTASVDRVVSGLTLNFLPDPARGVREMARVCRADGIVAAYVWDYAEGMVPVTLFWDTAVSLDPAAARLRDGLRFALCRPEPLTALFGGLRDVATLAIDVEARYRDFDDYWTPFLGGQGPAPAYCVRLPEPARDRLRDALRDRLGAGPFTLPVRAWAVAGTATRAGARPAMPPPAASTRG